MGQQDFEYFFIYFLTRIFFLNFDLECKKNTVSTLQKRFKWEVKNTQSKYYVGILCTIHVITTFSPHFRRKGRKNKQMSTARKTVSKQEHGLGQPTAPKNTLSMNAVRGVSWGRYTLRPISNCPETTKQDFYGSLLCSRNLKL